MSNIRVTKRKHDNEICMYIINIMPILGLYDPAITTSFQI